MPAAHLIFIPGVLLIGAVIGFIFGGRAARDAFEMEKRKEEQRATAKAARDAKRAARDGAGGTTTPETK